MTIKSFIISALILSTFSIKSCMLVKKNGKSLYMFKELNRTSWLLYSSGRNTGADTITFSFGRYNTGGEFNLLEYHSNEIKELCEFKLSKDTIIFNSYSAVPIASISNSDSCRLVSRIIYTNGSLRYNSIDKVCGENITRLDRELLNIRIRKL